MVSTKFYYFLFSFILLTRITIYPQNHWTNISGSFPGNIKAIGTNGNGEIIAGNDINQVYRSTDSGSTWNKLDFPTLIEPVEDIYFSSLHDVFVSDFYGLIYYSSDDGNTWSEKSNGLKNFDRIISIIKTPSGNLLAGAYTDCLSCNGGGIYRSTDNGNTWGWLTLLDNRVNSFVIDNNNDIYAAAYPGVYKSTDDGLTWQLFNNGMQQYESIYYLTIDEYGNIFAATAQYGGLMYESSDSGNSWTQVSAGLPDGNVTSLVSYDSLVFVSYTNEGVYKWNTTSQNWNKVSSSVSNFQFNGMAKNNNEIFAATNRGVYQSDYQGTTWQNITNSVAHLYISSIAKTSNGTLLAGTQDGGVYRTSNEGNYWIQNSILNTNSGYAVNNIKINSNGELFAGMNGYIISAALFKSTDNGISWNNVPGGYTSTAGITSLFIDQNNKLYTGEYRTMNYSTNDGQTWTHSVVYSSQSWNNAITAIPGEYILVATYGDGIFKSTNNGIDFYQCGLPNHHMYTIVMDSFGYIYAGDQGTVYRSTDNGSTWVEENSGMGTPGVSQLLVTKQDILLAATYQGFYYSTDQAEQWNQLNTGLDQTSLKAIYEDNDGNLYAGSTADGIFKFYGSIPVELLYINAKAIGNTIVLNWKTATETNNRGFEIERQVGSRQSVVGNWGKIGFVEGNGTTTQPHNYSFIDKDNISGSIKYRLKQIDFDGSYKYSNVVEVSITNPTKFSLEQNYPNPFNPSTVIVYQLPVNGQVSLKVYDVLGRKVETLVNEYKPAGKYEVEFYGKNLPSGIYFYKLQAGSFVQTKKMILLR